MTPVLLPAINLGLALVLSAIVVLLVGENPFRALKLLTAGAFGSGEAIGYTLYYATTFVFTGLAVAVAFHGGLFNIGAEGQAYIGGLGVALVCLAARRWPSLLVIPAAIVASAAFGAAWAFIPAWLQARRGSHIVITTIMFNFIAVVADDLSPGQRADQAGPAVAGDAGVRSEHVAAPASRGARRVRLAGRPLARQSVVRPRADRGRSRVVLPVAHAVGLCAQGLRSQRDGRRLWRHRADADGGRRHVDLRRAGRD